MNARCFFVLVSCCAGPIGAAETPRTDSQGDPLPAGAVVRLGTARLRHGGAVTSVAYAPDGRSVASAGFDRTVSLWDVATGRELVRYGGHNGDVRTIAFSPDGKTLASGGTDGTVRLWDVPRPLPVVGPSAGRELHVFNHDSAAVETLAFSRDGTLLATGTDHGVIAFWNVAQRRQVRSIALDGPVRCLAFDPSGKFLVGNGKKAAVRVWEVATGSEVVTFGDESIRCLAFSPDGRWLATGDFGNSVRLWDAATGQQKGQRLEHQTVAGPFSFVFSVAFAPDSKTLASAAGDGSVRLWDTASGTPKGRLTGHAGYVAAVAFAPDGKALVSGGSDHSVRLWDAATGKDISPVRSQDGPVGSLSLAADGKTLATLRSTGRLDLWDLARRSQRPLPVDLEPWQGQFQAATFAPSGLTLAVGIAPGTLRLVDLATNKTLFVGDKTAGPLAPLAFTPDGRNILGGLHHALVHRELPGGNRSERAERIAGSLSCLAVSRDGRSLAVGGTAGIRLWQADERAGIELSGGALTLAFSPDGRTLAQGTRSSLIGIWEVASGTLRKQIGGYPGWVRSLAYSPDGKLLASGDSGGAVRLWDAATGRALIEFHGQRGAVTAVVFTADGRQLLSGGADSTVLVWEVSAVSRLPRPTETLSREELADLWSRLSGESEDACLAIQKLACAPEQAVPLFRTCVHPVAARRVARLLKDLDNDDFATRERATEELAALGPAAERTFRQALTKKTSAEVRRRLQDLLTKLGTNETAPEVLRTVRAVEVLEMIGTTEARQVVATLAAGSKDFALTRAAKAALARMGK